MSVENGGKWHWISAFLEGFGPVFFEARRADRPAGDAVLVRRVTGCQTGQDAAGRTKMAVFPHPLFQVAAYGEETLLSVSAIVLWSPAPPKVAEVCEGAWQPASVLATAKESDANALARTLAKIRGQKELQG